MSMLRISRSIILSAVVAAIACGGSNAASPAHPDDLTYSLATINGRRVPAVLGENPLGKMEILSESYRLEPTLRYIRFEEYRQTDAAGVRLGTLTDTGTYVMRTDSVVFTFARSNGTFQTLGALESGRLVVRYAAQGVTLVYDPSR
jgi:hypothetical protein